jgi:hypothetical protein
MAYMGNRGRFRETRVGLFEANMGGEEAPVKSPSVENVEIGPNNSIAAEYLYTSGRTLIACIKIKHT